jgi:hypothetical protein
VRAREQEIRAIETQGTEEMRILNSPGFLEGELYQNEMRVEYLVQCAAADELAFFNLTFLDLQRAEDCIDQDGRPRCQDYLQIEETLSGTGSGSVEVCGDEPSALTRLQLRVANFTVVFRTSEEGVASGFEMHVVCFRPAEEGATGCVNATEFTTGVCAASESGDEPTRVPLPTESKRSAGAGQQSIPIASFYTDLFPNSGYPPHLRIRPDLAQFHQPWNILRGQSDVVVFEVDILYNQTVNYDKDLVIMDLDGQELARYCFVDVLETFGPDGTIKTYTDRVSENRFPHFYGPGHLRIANRRGYFQLFRIDPRGLVPNEAEETDLYAMVAPLLASSVRFSRLFIRDVNNPQFSQTDRDAVLAALRSENSCNAVLRAQSRATLGAYNRVNSTFVDCLRTFSISCVFSGRTLMCLSEDHLTLPGRTTCQFNVQGESPMPCDPFPGPDLIVVPPRATTVTVRAINCLGQTATQTVNVAQVIL